MDAEGAKVRGFHRTSNAQAKGQGQKKLKIYKHKYVLYVGLFIFYYSFSLLVICFLRGILICHWKQFYHQ